MDPLALPPTAQFDLQPGLLTRDPRAARRDLATGLVLCLMTFALFLLPSPWRALSETAEARIAVVAREMLRTGDWIVPRLNDEPRLNKPPLPYWLVAISACALNEGAKTDQVTEQAVFLPSAVLGALCVFLVVVFGARVFGRTAGLWAGLILGLSVLFVRFSQWGAGEMPLTFFTTASLISAAWLACVPRPGPFCALALGVSLGLAVLTKAQVPVLMVCGALSVEAVRRRRFDLRKILLFIFALAIAAAIVTPWCAAILEAVPDGASTAWKEIRGTTRMTAHDQDDWYAYYLYQLAWSLLPWTPLLLVAWPTAARRERREGNAPSSTNFAGPRFRGFFLGAAVAGFLGFSMAAKQQYYYLLPILPPLALAAGNALARLERPGGKAEERVGWATIFVGLLAALGIGLLPLYRMLAVGDSSGASESAPWEVTVPLGLIAGGTSFVAARQWAEGRAASAGIALGIGAYLALGAWTLLVTWGAGEKSERRHFLELRAMLPTRAEIYIARLKSPREVVLYYLDRPRILKVDDLVARNVDSTGRPLPSPPGRSDVTRILICPRAFARALGYNNVANDICAVELPADNAQINWAPFLHLLRGRKPP